MKKILWIDDEIDLLKPHIIYLKNKGFSVEGVTNGFDGIKKVHDNSYNIVILDEMMIGMTGLEALKEIKQINPELKAIMLTKSEEEDIFRRAIGEEIADYLTKPISPLQLYLTIEKNFEKEKLISSNIEDNFKNDINEIERLLTLFPESEDWTEINSLLCELGLKLDKINNSNLETILHSLSIKANNLFTDFIKKNYAKWFSDENNLRKPLQSQDVLEKIIIKDHKKRQNNENKNKTALIVIDSLRTDQLRVLRKLLPNNTNISELSYYSILPSTTAFTRPTLLSGMLPNSFPSEYIKEKEEDKPSPNDYLTNNQNLIEETLLKNLLDKNEISTLKGDFNYTPLSKIGESIIFKQQYQSLSNCKFLTISFNLLDFIARHNNNDLVSELVKSDKAFRSTIKSWFEHSILNEIINDLIEDDFVVYITSDHGCQKMSRYSELTSNEKLTNGHRYKFGKSIKVKNKKQTFFIQVPGKIGLPSTYNGTNLVISTEDYTFVEENKLGLFYSGIKNSYQHGGISLEEMIIPILRVENNNK